MHYGTSYHFDEQRKTCTNIDLLLMLLDMPHDTSLFICCTSDRIYHMQMLLLKNYGLVPLEKKVIACVFVNINIMRINEK